MLLLGVSKKTYWCLGYNATVLDADSRVWMFTMHGRIQKILSGGGGGGGGGGWVSWKLYFSFSQRAVRTWPTFRSYWNPKGSYFISRLSITVFLRKHKTTCGLPGGMQTLCPRPSGHAYAMLSKQSELCSSVSSSLLNIHADRRSHPAYFWWRTVSSPDDSRRPSCQLLV